MSFFIKGKQTNGHGKVGNKKFTGETRKRKLPSKPQSYKEKDDEVTSSEDEGLNNKEDNNVPSSSEDENETAQEKKLRLAKVYLQEIEREEKRRLENKELDDALKGDGVSQRLKEDYLKQQGRLRSSVAHKYTGYNADTLTLLKCKDHKNSLTCLCVSDDSKFIYSGSKDGGIVKWSLESKKKVASLPFVKKAETKNILGHSQSILSIAISSDSQFLAVGDESSNIQIWNPVNLNHINTLSGHRGSITGLTFRKDTHTLYSASKDRSIKCWSLDEMLYVETMYGHLDGITNIDCLARERCITSGGRDSSIRIWKVAEESQLIYNGDGSSMDAVRLINEENFISGGDNGQLCIWGVNKKKPLCFVKEAHGVDPANQQPFWITSVASLLNTDLIASGSQDGFIKVWKLGDGFRQIDLLFKIPITGFVNSMAFTHDGKYLLAATGTEHRFGRWNVIKNAKNGIHIISLVKDT